MGHRELIDALRREAEQSAAEIRSECEAEAVRIREETAARLAVVSGEYARRQIALRDTTERSVLAEAARRGRLVRLTAENALAERLYDLARQSLASLRGNDEWLFAALVAELPSAAWESVTVNPADARRAARFFPAARIVADAAVTGGLEATAAGGRLRVVNTFEKRLERGWPELLPGLVRDAVREL